MTEDEKKTQATAGQSEHPDQGTVESVAAPRDGEGREGVTVVIIARDRDQGTLMGRSVYKNLTGVDADIHLVTEEHLRDTDLHTLLDHLPHVHTERIILMTDGMVMLNPVLLGDIACVKAVKKGDYLDYNTLMPVLMHKSALQQLLDSIKDEKPHADIVNEYFHGCMPDGFQPVVLRSWREECWLMPVVSKNPNTDALRQWGKRQKFAHIGPESWSDDLVKYLEERFSK